MYILMGLLVVVKIYNNLMIVDKKKKFFLEGFIFG